MAGPRRSGSCVFLLISGVLLLFSSTVLAGAGGETDLERYEEACRLYDSGNYDEAKPMLEELSGKDLGFWKNRSVKNYLAAIEKKAAKDGEAAAAPAQSDSQPDIANYEQGIKLYKEGAYDEAEALLAPLKDKDLGASRNRGVTKYLAAIEKQQAAARKKEDAAFAKAQAKEDAAAAKAQAEADRAATERRSADQAAKSAAEKEFVERNYDQAVKLYGSGNYEDARALFETLGDRDLGYFKNRKVKSYLASIEKQKAEATTNAARAVEKEKAEQVQARTATEQSELLSKYEEGTKLYSDGDYDRAEVVFQELRFKDLGMMKNRRIRKYLSAIEKHNDEQTALADKRAAAEQAAGAADTSREFDAAAKLFADGKLDEAEREFLALSQKNISASTSRDVAEYLDRIREKKAAVAAVAAAAVAGDEPEPAPEPVPELVRPADPVLARAHEILEREKGLAVIMDERDRFLAQHHINVGKSYYKRFEYEKARVEFRKALDLDKRSVDAQRYLDTCNTMLDVRKGRIKEYAIREFEIRTAEVEKARIEMRRLYEEGKELLEAKNFDEAMTKFHAVREIIHWMPFREDVSEYDRGTTELITQATEEKLKWKEEMDLLKAEEAAIQLREEIEAERMYKKQRIRMLMIQAKEFERIEQFSKAIEIYDEILTLEPELFMANVRKTGCQRRLLQKQRRTIDRDKKLAIEEGWINAKALSKPQVETLRMPDDWDIIKKRSTPTFGGKREVPEWEKAIHETLDSRRISFYFQETQLTKVLSFLADLTGLDFIPQLDEGVDPPVTLRVNRMALRNALDWIGTLTGTKWAVDRQAIFFGARVLVKPELRFYPIKDIMFQIVDYPGPTLQISTDDDEGFALPDAAVEATVIPAETIIQYIQNIETDSWVDPNKIEYHAGMLLVINSAEVHKKVEELLSHFRSTRGLQVSINSQFIELNDNFLEDLGVDWRGLTGRPINEVAVTGGADAGILGPTGEDTDWRLRIQNQADTSVGRAQSNTGGLGLSMSILDDIQVKAVLHAVQKKSRGDILVAPKLTCFDGQRAHVLVADQTAYISGYEVEAGAAGGGVGATPQIKRVLDGVALDVRPIVSADRKYITMEVHPSLSRVTAFNELNVSVGGQIGVTVPIQLPLASIKIIHTTVMIPDGGTILIGGLMDRQESHHNISVPFLSKIPILNNLFRKKAESVERRNLVILLRGKIVDLSGGELGGGI